VIAAGGGSDLIIDDGMLDPRHAFDLGSFAMLAYMVDILGKMQAHLGSTSDASITSFIAVAKQSIGVAVLDDMSDCKVDIRFWMAVVVGAMCLFFLCFSAMLEMMRWILSTTVFWYTLQCVKYLLS
jgi:hypothetical protein